MDGLVSPFLWGRAVINRAEAVQPALSAACKRVHKSPAVRRAEIMAAAARVFAGHGYRAADTQQVADLAGVGKGTVYRYFPTKEALFLATLDFKLQELLGRTDAVLRAHDEPIAQLREVMRAYLGFFDQNPEVVELFVQERAEFRDRATPLYFVYSESCRQDFVAAFEQLVAEGRTRHDNVEAMMQFGADLLYGAVFWNRLSASPRSLGERFDELFTFFIHGILKDGFAS